MPVLTLKGSPAEIGRQWGRVLRKNNFRPPFVPKGRIDFVKACAQAAAFFAPRLLEELGSIADAAGCDPIALSALELTLDASPGCSALACVTGKGPKAKVLFGRNYDFTYARAKFDALCLTSPSGRMSSAGGTDLFTGRYDGVNEAGLAVAVAGVGGFGNRPGLVFSLAAREVLDRFGNVKDAAAFLAEVPHVRPVNFLLADPSGDAAIIEAAPLKVVVKRSRSPVLAITNHFQSEEMLPFENTARRSPDSEERLARIRKWQRGGAATPARLRKLLSDPKAGLLVHRPDARKPRGTLWSWHGRLGERILHLASGTPSGREYRKVEF